MAKGSVSFFATWLVGLSQKSSGSWMAWKSEMGILTFQSPFRKKNGQKILIHHCTFLNWTSFTGRTLPVKPRTSFSQGGVIFKYQSHVRELYLSIYFFPSLLTSFTYPIDKWNNEWMINKFVYLVLMKLGKVTNNCVCLVFNYEQCISSVLRVTLYEHALRQMLGSWNKAPKMKMFRI